jgi:subtilisin family serine protease
MAETSQRDLRATLDAQGIDYQPFYIVNALKMQAEGAVIQSLAMRSDVARIVPNPWVKGVPSTAPGTGPDTQSQSANSAPDAIESSLVRVNADDVWALGYTGQGIVVAGQDTGYDWDHPALRDQYRGWDGSSANHDYNWHDAIHSGGGACGPDSIEPCDDHGHGTHTMGTIVGDDGVGNQVGMAPGAEWIGCRNMDQGFGTPATYMECFEFFLAPYPVGGTVAQGVPELAPDVVSNSWGCPPSEGCDAETLEASVAALRQAGIVTVVSAGNSGSSCGSVDDPPALYQQSFTVANYDHHTDALYGSSSRGPVTYGGDTYTKPDIAAPGTNIRSSLRGGGYGYKTGTSMAAPHVAGAVVLLLSAAPGYKGQVDTIEQILTNTAEPRTTAQGCGGDGPSDVPNNAWGWGILDALAAVQLTTGGSMLQGQVTDAQSAAPLVGAKVRADSVVGPAFIEILTDPTGYYTLTLATDTYNVTAQADGYASQTITGVVVTEGMVTVQDFALSPLHRFYFPLVHKN